MSEASVNNPVADLVCRNLVDKSGRSIPVSDLVRQQENIDSRVLAIPDVDTLRGVTGKYPGQLAYVDGYYSSQPGFGGGFFSCAGNDAGDDDSGSVVGGWVAIFEGSVPVSRFGAAGDGVTDDGEAIYTANEFAKSQKKPLVFESGKTYLIAGQSYQVDAYISNWVCAGKASLQWSTAPADYAINLMSSSRTGFDDNGGYERRHKQVRPALDGLSVLGGPNANTLYPAKGVVIGSSFESNAIFSVINTCVQGWSNPLYFIENSYKIHFYNCQIMWGVITSEEYPANMGEAFVFTDCFISDGAMRFEVKRGDWFIKGCSIDNCTLVSYNDARFFVDQCHFENPGSTRNNHRFADVNSANSSISIKDSFFVVRGGNRLIEPVFRVHDQNKQYGLLLDNIHFPTTDAYRPDLGTTGVLSLVQGEGRVLASNIYHAINNYTNVAIGLGANSIRNGYLRGGLSGWSTTGTVTQASETAYMAASRESGTGNTLNSSLSQKIPCSSGQIVTGGYIGELSGNGTASCQLIFRDIGGAVIPAGDIASRTHTSSDQNGWRRLGAYAPAGTASVELRFATSLGSGSDPMEYRVKRVLLSCC